MCYSSQIMSLRGRSICTNPPKICCRTTAFQMSCWQELLVTNHFQKLFQNTISKGGYFKHHHSPPKRNVPKQAYTVNDIATTLFISHISTYKFTYSKLFKTTQNSIKFYYALVVILQEISNSNLSHL